MAHRFGQNAFAAVSGVVSAAGLAVCLAIGHGQIEVIKRATGVTASVAAQIQATQYRTRKIPVLVAQASANASGHAKADWLVAGIAQAGATGYGRGTADFFGYGYADGTVQFVGKPVRLAKVRTFPAKATATLEGEAFIHQILHGKPAECRATLYGTTYHLAYGTAVCTASASGQVSWKAGVTSEAMATAVAEATAQYTMSLWPDTAHVEASVRAEDALTVGGVRYLEVFGEAVGTVVAENTHVAIYPSVTAFVTANLSGRAAYVLGGQGHAQGLCTLTGTMIAASTAVTLVQGDSVSSATGRIRAHHRFKGEAHSQAVGNGIPLVTHTGVTGTGVSSASGSGTVQVRNTKVYPDDAYGTALLKGRMNRVKSVSGVGANVYSVFQVKMRRIQNAHGVASALATLAGKQYRTRLFGGAAHAQATGVVLNVHLSFPVAAAVVTAQLSGQIRRDQYLAGEAVAEATSLVGIQVNDAARAPITRTMVVLREARTTVVLQESRTIVV
jgi:hypothetical protein